MRSGFHLFGERRPAARRVGGSSEILFLIIEGVIQGHYLILQQTDVPSDGTQLSICPKISPDLINYSECARLLFLLNHQEICCHHVNYAEGVLRGAQPDNREIGPL